MRESLVPVYLSASHIAYCSLRMEPHYMALVSVDAVKFLESSLPSGR